MATERYNNNGRTTVAVSYSAGSTTLVVDDGSILPTLTGGDQFHVTVYTAATPTNPEIMRVTGRSGNTLTVVPAAEVIAGVQTQYDHPSGDIVACSLTVEALNQITQQIAGALIINALIAHEAESDPHPQYLTQTEGDGLYSALGHVHDDRYYTEAEITTFLSGKANTVHTHVVDDITDFTTGVQVVTDPLYQPADSDLDTWATLTPSADAQALVVATYAGMRTQLSLVPGTDFLSPGAIAALYQPLDATLTGLSAIDASTANRLIVSDGANSFTGMFFGANQFPARNSAGDITQWPITDFGLSLVDDADNTTARTTLGLGTVATLASDTDGTLAANSDARIATQKATKTYVDALSSVYAAINHTHTFASLTSKPTTLSGYGITDGQPLDSDLTAIAALTTDSFGRGLLEKTTAAAVRTYIGAGTGSGDVVGPASATDEALARYDLTTGKLLQNSAVTVTDAGLTTITVSDAVTNASVAGLTVIHNSSGTPAANFGVAVMLKLEEATGSATAMAGSIVASWITATAGATSSRIKLFAYAGANSREILCGADSGAAPAIGFLGANPIIAQTGDIGTALVAFGLMSGTPTFAYANLTGAPTIPTASIDYSTPSGMRLSLTTALPVTTSNVTAAGTIYLTVYKADYILVPNAGTTDFDIQTPGEKSLSLTLTSGKNYDVFMWNNSGTMTLALSSAWTNDTTRADALGTLKGIQVNNATIGSMGAKRGIYIGTIRATGTNTTEDSTDKRFVWNQYNRVQRPLFRVNTTAGWTYNSATWRGWNASTDDRVQLISGLAEDNVQVTAVLTTFYSNTGSQCGVGVNSTTTPTGGFNGGSNTAAGNQQIAGNYNGIPPMGFNFFQGLENSALGTYSTYGTDASRAAVITGHCFA